ncbi:hypothetical protein AR158_c038L [Paramecium bursaria Chlorella virus AR158]|uniref:hypothetical protein n=1 Tax=Paramecium bursaria Chlorella virus AR158 TaxID=380598 RepID=UPI00015AA745|nr:hypothetical protein AR158_c038L [Paramecium bursaria Chlorella virus AR158]ABU43584.1 hypothetical protein AR158_c038L [Paramecium bursaria Chlorella virus AR158]
MSVGMSLRTISLVMVLCFRVSHLHLLVLHCHHSYLHRQGSLQMLQTRCCIRTLLVGRYNYNNIKPRTSVSRHITCQRTPTPRSSIYRVPLLNV